MDAKRAFYAIRDHLAKRPDHLARVVLGASCEGWLNAEAAVALNWAEPAVLGSGEVAVSESGHRDLVVRLSGEVTHTIEIKVLYPLPSSKLQQERLDVLRRQVEREPHDDERHPLRRVGLIFAIWTSNYHRETAGEFFRRASGLVEATFPAEQFATQHGYVFERVSALPTVQLAGLQQAAEVAALYFTRRR